MANQTNQRSASAAKAGGRSKLSARVIGTAVVLLPAIAVLMPSCILLGLGMAPTIVAYVVDRTREKYLAITVGLLNLCGVLPGLVRLWSEGQTYDVALRVAGNPYTMFMAYGAAAIGWAVYLALPHFLAHYYATTTATRLRALQERQDALIEIWGEEIAGEPPAKPD